MLDEGRYLWNAGLFLARADVLIAAFKAHAPAVLEAVTRSLAGAQPDLGFLRLDIGPDRVAELTPIRDARVFLCQSGSESIDTAMKIARASHVQAGRPERRIIISRDRGYNGTNYGGTSAQGLPLNKQGYGELLADVVQAAVGPGVTAKDIVLAIIGEIGTAGGTGYVIEFGGRAIRDLSVEGRMTVCNMTIEAGARAGIVAVDEKTVEYLRMTNRGQQADLVETYTRENALFFTGAESPEYTDVLELDLATVEPCVAGPARPQDRIPLKDLKSRFADILGCAYDRDEEVARVSQFHDESGSQTSRLPRCFPVMDGACDIDSMPPARATASSSPPG